MMEKIDKLVFVYNAEKDVLNSILGYAHKVFSPATYPCELCSITHSNLGERKVWKEFRLSQSVKMVFIYRTEFNELFNISADLPVVISVANGNEKVLLTKNEISKLSDSEELMNEIKLKMQTNH